MLKLHGIWGVVIQPSLGILLKWKKIERWPSNLLLWETRHLAWQLDNCLTNKTTIYRQELSVRFDCQMVLFEQHFGKLIWLVVWTHLKNTSQLGWLFPIYGKIKNVPNHQPVIWCFFSINHYFNSSPKDVDLVFSIVPNLRGHETKKWTAARPKNPQAKQALFVWREELMPQRPNPTP